MTPEPRARRRRPEERDRFPEAGLTEIGLTEIGLTPGDAVRFRRRDTERWKTATVARREKDGSIGLHDAKGAARSISLEFIEVRTIGPRGGVVWEPLSERAERTEQIPLVRESKQTRSRPKLARYDSSHEDPIGPAAPAPPAQSAEQLRLL